MNEKENRLFWLNIGKLLGQVKSDTADISNKLDNHINTEFKYLRQKVDGLSRKIWLGVAIISVVLAILKFM